MSEDRTGEIENTPSPDEKAAPSAEINTEKTEEAKKPNKVQERINQLTREKHEARQRNTELEERLSALESKSVETKPSEIVVPSESDFDDDDGYQKAHAKYVADNAADVAYKRLSAEQKERDRSQQANARQEELGVKQKAFNTKLDSKRSQFEDFENIAYGHQFMDGELAEQIYDLEKGPEVAYHLGSHLDEADRIFKLPPVQRARELTKLEFKLEDITPKKVSGAPDPITPLGNSESVQDDPDKMNADQWRAWRNKQVHG